MDYTDSEQGHYDLLADERSENEMQKQKETNDAQELFSCRYWYTWETAQKWPTASVVLCRWRVERKWYYSLITYFQPDGKHIAGTEYLLIERDTLQGPDE